LHGNSSYRVPWLYDDEAVDVTRRFTQLKCRLMPYLMGLAVTAHTRSIPMMRAMVLQYPDDLACRTLDRQYCLGDDLLVAPVFHESRAEYYLPGGEWVHLLTGERRTGGRWFTEDVGFSSVPLWLAQNGVVAMSANTDIVEYDYAKRVRLVLGVSVGDCARTVEIFDATGTLARTFTVDRRGATISVKSNPPNGDFEVQLPFVTQARSIEGGHHVQAEAASLPGDPGGLVVAATGADLRISWA
jgi:alpha-D-xyloside xylohydrolase